MENSYNIAKNNQTNNPKNKGKDLGLGIGEFNPVEMLNIFKMKSIRCMLITTIMILIGILIASLYLAEYFLLRYIYSLINDKYLNSFIIEPIRVNNENYTEILLIRERVINNIFVEANLKNLEIALKYNTNKGIFFNDFLKIDMLNSTSSQMKQNGSLTYRESYQNLLKNISVNNALTDVERRSSNFALSRFNLIPDIIVDTIISNDNFFLDNVFPNEIILYEYETDNYVTLFKNSLKSLSKNLLFQFRF